MWKFGNVINKSHEKEVKITFDGRVKKGNMLKKSTKETINMYITQKELDAVKLFISKMQATDNDVIDLDSFRINGLQINSTN